MRLNANDDGRHMMSRNDSIITAIRQKDVGSVLALMFSENYESIKQNYKTETELWDYKRTCPNINSRPLEWAEISKDVLAFHNTGKGGILVFGVEDKNYSVLGLSGVIVPDSKVFNDKIRRYVGDTIWVDYYTIENEEKNLTLGLALIPPLSNHSSIKRFLRNGPEKHGKPLFFENGSALRKNDSSITLSPHEANEILLSRPAITYKEYEIDEPCYRLLSADYHEFILRQNYCQDVMRGLHFSRATSVCLIGIGGVGKTALATWAVKNAYKNDEYDYIVSISAKDRELTTSGIQSINQKLTSLNDLLDSILDVIGFPEGKLLEDSEKLSAVQNLIAGEKVLLFIDNLETTIDKEIIRFISNLPEPVKAIITSRRNVINISSYPVEIGPLENEEIISYISSLSALPSFAYCKALSDSEKEQIGMIFNGIPLAIKWVLGKSSSAEELLSKSQNMNTSGMQNEELLEFSFRRVFDDMSLIEKSVMQVLAVISDLPIEAIIQGCGMRSKSSDIIDALETLIADTIVIRYYDPLSRSDKYRLLSLTQKFMLNNCISAKEEQAINRRLSFWYNAGDIADPEEKELVSAMRQGGQNMGVTLTSFAESAAQKGDIETAVKFFEAALSRDPQNWKVFWRYGEYFRHVEQSVSQAISMYETALRLSQKEKITSEIAILNREFGLIYGSSGRPDAIKRATEHFELALKSMPHDPICARGLASMYEKRGHSAKIINILEPFKHSSDSKTKKMLLPMLLKAYKSQPEKYMLEIAQLELVIGS